MRMDQAYRADRVPGTGSDNRTVITVVVLAALALTTWIYLALGRGRFWSTAVRLPTALSWVSWSARTYMVMLSASMRPAIVKIQ